MKSDRIIASIMIAFVIFWGFLTTKLPETTMEGEPGPKFFPTVILGLMAILSVFLFFKSSKDHSSQTLESSEEPSKESAEVAEETKEETPSMKRIFSFYGVFFLALILTYYFGFLIGLIIGMIALLTMAGWGLFPRATVFSVIVTVGVYLLFDTLLKIPLPTGTLF